MKTRYVCLPLLLALFYSTLSYAQWVQVNNGLNNTAILPNQNIVVSPQIQYANVYRGPLLTDSIVARVPAGSTGSTLERSPSFDFFYVVFSHGISGWCYRRDLVHPVPVVLSFTIKGTNLFAGTTDGVFRSTNNGTTWMPVDQGLLIPYTDYYFIHAMAAFDTNIFIATGYGMYRSTDNGNDWDWDNWGFPRPYLFINTLAISSTKVLASTRESVFLSTNSGESWNKVDSSATDLSATSLAVIGTNLWAGTENGAFLSANGSHWAPASIGLPQSTQINCFAVSGSDLFAGTLNGGIHSFPNNGTGWTKRNEGMTSNSVNAIAVSGRNLFAGTADGGICVSNNNGWTWTEVNCGLPDPYPSVIALMASSTDLFAGTENGILRRPLTEIVASINQPPAVAYSFKLGQNYPNPFNPSTQIAFSITKGGPVSLRVYDILGHELATLVNENLKPGQYTERFDGSRVASGVYVYVLRSSEGLLTSKMVLSK
jgi:ligand-binding sensor domain-containing protein